MEKDRREGGLITAVQSADSRRFEEKAGSQNHGFFRKAVSIISIPLFYLLSLAPYSASAVEQKKEQPEQKPPYCQALPGVQIDRNVQSLEVLDGKTLRQSIEKFAELTYGDNAARSKFIAHATQYLKGKYPFDTAAKETCRVPLCIEETGCPSPQLFSGNDLGPEKVVEAAAPTIPTLPAATTTKNGAGVDNDKDGYFSKESGGDDCNDNDPNINPKAEETCGNSIDENCNGVADEPGCNSGAGVCGTYYGSGNYKLLQKELEAVNKRIGGKDKVKREEIDDIIKKYSAYIDVQDIDRRGEKGLIVLRIAESCIDGGIIVGQIRYDEGFVKDVNAGMPLHDAELAGWTRDLGTYTPFRVSDRAIRCKDRTDIPCVTGETVLKSLVWAAVLYETGMIIAGAAGGGNEGGNGGGSGGTGNCQPWDKCP